MYHYRPLELRRKIRFIRRSQVAAPFKLVFYGSFRVRFLQHLHGFVVGDAWKWRLDLLQLCDVTSDYVQVRATPLEAALNQKTDESFSQVHEVVERGIGDLGFDHPELGQVATGLRFLGAKSRTEGIHLAQRHRGRFDVKLTRLCKERLLTQEVNRKQSSRTFGRCRGDDGRIGQRKATLIEKVSRCFDDLGSHAQNRCLTRTTHPKMPVLHEEVDAMFLRRDRVGV